MLVNTSQLPLQGGAPSSRTVCPRFPKVMGQNNNSSLRSWASAHLPLLLGTALNYMIMIPEALMPRMEA